MKRILVVMTLLIALGAAAIASLPLLLSSEAVRDRIVARISGITGQQVTFRGDPSVSFSPFMGVEISELEISGRDDQPLLSIERVKGKLKLLSAIRGEIELHELRFLRPRLQLNSDASGNANWQLESGSLKDAFDATVSVLQENDTDAPFVAVLGSYQIEDGVIEYNDEIDGTSETITNINALLDWPDTNSAVTVNGSAVLRNENGSIDFSAVSPMRILAGGESDVSVTFSSEPLEFVFNGKANTISNLFAKGALRASTPSVIRLSDFLEFDFGESNAVVGKWEAEGVFEGTANMALLSDAKLSIGDNNATGVVGLSRTETGKIKLDGTLAFNEIDLSNYLQGNIESINETIRSNNQDSLALDLRLSANTMNVGDLIFENVAASVTSGDEGWIFDIGNATAFGGSLVASLGSANEGEKTQLILKFSSKDTDLGAISIATGRESAVLLGTGSIKADLRTPLPVSSTATLPINGQISIESVSGSIEGIDFAGLFGLAEEAEGVNPGNLETEGQTVFESLSINAFLNNSRATISKAQIQTTDRNIQILGDADISNGSLALTAQEISEEGPISDRLVIGGTFLNPLVSLKPAPARNKTTKQDGSITDENKTSSASH